ncbi:MAG: SAM-dependent chlorinase/fluorinase, partial [Prosthecochloris sp.]
MRDKRQQVIALLTDFGLQDTYVGIMKGVIASIAPEASVIDLTHSVAPQHIRQGALLLGSS